MRADPAPDRRSVALVALVAAVTATPTAAQERCRGPSAELYAGSAWNLPLPLVVEQDGARARFTGRYSTRAFADAPYYSYRVGWGSERRRVEAEMLHHKLYLENPRPPVERFEVSHGFNQPMLNLAVADERRRWRVGLGLVVAHAEGRIGGRDVGPVPTVLGGGYQIAGASTQVALGRWYHLLGTRASLVAAPELKLTGAVARMRTAGGSVRVANVALHALGGLGVRRRCG